MRSERSSRGRGGRPPSLRRTSARGGPGSAANRKNRPTMAMARQSSSEVVGTRYQDLYLASGTMRTARPAAETRSAASPSTKTHGARIQSTGAYEPGDGRALREEKRPDGRRQHREHLRRALDSSEVTRSEPPPDREEHHRDHPARQADERGKDPELRKRHDERQHDERQRVDEHRQPQQPLHGPAERQPSAPELPDERDDRRRGKKRVVGLLIEPALGQNRLVEEAEP